jgi:hypothetical protein
MINSALHWLQSRRAEMLIRLISFDFSLSFYSIFPRPDPPLNPCGYWIPAWWMMKHVSFSPNLYTTICQFYVMFLVTFIVTCLQAAYVQTTQRRHAKNVTNLKLLTYVDCKVTSSVSEDSPESSYYSKLISRRRKRSCNQQKLHWTQ